MDPDYKARKEAFVSNLAGSDIQDINLVTLVAPVQFLAILDLVHSNQALLHRPPSFSGPLSNRACPISPHTVLPHC